MYQALYRKYRPQTFDDVVGQSAVTMTLKNQLTSGHLGHAYLFTGSRGTGKTSCARILAKAVNCENPQDGNPCNCCKACRSIDAGTCMDVLEIDAASNNGVDNVRDLRDDAIYTPSEVKKRVYIIDEVHMLSTSAFNALLKIVEEPPEHLVFILATTELHKVPATILSRCQRFSFRRIGQENIAARLQYVAYQESIDLTDDAARVIARLADGAMRDGLSLLDQCASATIGELNAARVYDCLGIAGEQSCSEMMGYIAGHDTQSALSLFDRLYAEGKDVAAMLDELACLTRDLCLLKTAPEAGLTMLSGVSDGQDARRLAGRFAAGELTRMMNLLQETLAGFAKGGSRRMEAELCLIKLCQPELMPDAESLSARISRLEDQIHSGNLVVTSAPTVVREAPPPQAKQEAIPAESPAKEEMPVRSEAPVGFFPDLFNALKKEHPGPAFNFSGIRGVLQGDVITLYCGSFSKVELEKPENLQPLTERASGMLKRPVRVIVKDNSPKAENNSRMQDLLAVARENPGTIHIKGE